MPKIFCIGLNKTGTSSLHQAMLRLGFSSLHWGGFDANQKIYRAIADDQPLFYYFEREFDAYSDFEPLTSKFDLADEQYPGSKFIHTWRDLESWLHSRKCHVQQNQIEKRCGRYPGDWTTIERKKWIRLWYAHREKVQAYFRNRQQDLLTINICAGQGYELLCPFLNRPVLAESFPWKNKNGNNNHYLEV